MLGLIVSIWSVPKTAMVTAKTVATRARVLARSGLSPTRHPAAAAPAPALTAGKAAVGHTQAPRHRWIAKALGSILSLRRKNSPSERLLAPTAGPCLNAG